MSEMTEPFRRHSSPGQDNKKTVSRKPRLTEAEKKVVGEENLRDLSSLGNSEFLNVDKKRRSLGPETIIWALGISL